MTIIKSLVELAQAIEGGEKIECFCKKNEAWNPCNLVSGGDSIGYSLVLIKNNRLRIKPKSKNIDLSFFLGSGIDFEKRTALSWVLVGPIDSIDSFDRYRPRMYHWMSPENCDDMSIHSTLENAGFEVEVIDGNDKTVAAFMVTGVREGYTL